MTRRAEAAVLFGPGTGQHKFAGLAESRGVSIRMCVAAAETGRLADVLRLPVVGAAVEAAHVRRLAELHARREGAPERGTAALARMADRRPDGSAATTVAAKREALRDRHRVQADWDGRRRQWRVTDPRGRVGYGATIEDAVEDWFAGVGA
jgi:hypothetical protein